MNIDKNAIFAAAFIAMFIFCTWLFLKVGEML
jgi:hypothetical protein